MSSSFGADAAGTATDSAHSSCASLPAGRTGKVSAVLMEREASPSVGPDPTKLGYPILCKIVVGRTDLDPDFFFKKPLPGL